ncbi:MAG: ABC transporter ATP-binding protein [Syntrophobacteraceae bacterium]
MSLPCILLDHVAFVRSKRQILHDISWTVPANEHWVVLGPNGSGKTTLLQLLAGYLWPTEGRISVLGEQFGHVDLRELRKRIGWVGSFLQVQIPSAQRPLDLIVSGKFASVGIFEKPLPDDYANARSLARKLRCDHILDQPYGVLSQGEKQRLLIARAMIHHPKLLILDEPCAGLDLVAREQLLESLETLGRTAGGPTMVLVTHHLEEITPIFSHVLMLKEGRCVGQGPKDTLLNDQNLSSVFGMALRVERTGDRYWGLASPGAIPAREA